MDIDYQDKIDRYLLGEMTAEEKASFEKTVKSDGSLSERLEMTRIVRLELKKEAELREKMRRWDERIDEEERLTLEERLEREREEKRREKEREREKLRLQNQEVCFMEPVFMDMSSADGAVEPDGAGDTPETLETCAYVAEPAERKPEPKKKRPPRWPWYSLGGVAALLIVGFVVSRTFIGSPGINRGEPLTSAPNPYPALRGSDDLGEIRLLMDSCKWEEALAQIDEDILEVREELGNVGAVEGSEWGEEEEYSQTQCEQRLGDLCWLKVSVLLELGRNDDALQLLDSLRLSGGEYAQRADSLYLYLKTSH